MNPLLAEINTPFETVPFEQIENAHYMPALEQAIARAKQEIEAIAVDAAPATFENTIEALDRCGYLLHVVSRTFFNMTSAETDDELQKIAKSFSPRLTEYGNDVLLDSRLFERIKTVYQQKDKLELATGALTPEQRTLLEKTWKDFARNGALLNDEGKTRLREIDKDLSGVLLDFSENVLKETNKYEMLIEDKEELAGLPDAIIDAAAISATEKGFAGSWLFTLAFPSYLPFITYSSNRKRREQLYRAFASKCNKGDELDNKQNIRKILQLRHQRAKLLGYPNHAEFVLEERMAESPERVMTFLNDLLEHSLAAGKREMTELQAYAVQHDGPAQLQNWDYFYYAEMLKKERFDIDDQLLKPYFQLEKAVGGLFQVAQKLYGLSFTERSDIPKYHEEVKTFQVQNEKGEHVAIFYADFFPRAGKQNGAWMTSYRDQFRSSEGGDKRPHIAIVCNFTPPTETQPSLLTFREVQTLFHEFGHALHGILSECHYRTLSGTSVYWDFVELPSQIMENWLFEKDCLNLFATHYENGEVIPEQLVAKIRASANFHEARNTVRQLSFAFLDMAWHSTDPDTIDDIEQFEEQVTAKTLLLPKVEGTNASCSFGHIFPGGYAAGYYSYKWAEVLDADAFEEFKSQGIFNPQVANSFRENILSKGGSEHPMTLYKRFRGKEPAIEPLLKRGGLI